MVIRFGKLKNQGIWKYSQMTQKNLILIMQLIMTQSNIVYTCIRQLFIAARGKYFTCALPYFNRAPDKREYSMITEGYFDFFLIENICCDPSSELSCRDNSDEGSQHKFLCRIDKNYLKLSLKSLSNLELCFTVNWTACLRK